jgi:flagellar M-ring protein FliF
MTWDQFKSQNSASTTLTVDGTWVDLISKGTGINSSNISVLAYQRPYFEDSTTTSIFATASFWIQIALAVAILGLLAFVVIRSARPLTVEEKEPELSVEEMLATTKENQPVVEEIDLQEKSETRKAIEKFVDENPEAVALLLRNWLNDDWG